MTRILSLLMVIICWQCQIVAIVRNGHSNEHRNWEASQPWTHDLYSNHYRLGKEPVLPERPNRRKLSSSSYEASTARPCSSQCQAYRQRVQESLHLSAEELEAQMQSMLRELREQDSGRTSLVELSLSDATVLHKNGDRIGSGFVIRDHFIEPATAARVLKESQSLRNSRCLVHLTDQSTGSSLRAGEAGAYGVVPELRGDFNVALTLDSQHGLSDGLVNGHKPAADSALHSVMQSLKEFAERELTSPGSESRVEPIVCANCADHSSSMHRGLRDHTNSSCLLSLDLSKTEFMLGFYPANGARYRGHRDTVKLSNVRAVRLVTAIVYVNDRWLPENGGQLRLHLNEGVLDIEPVAGRLVVFLSPLVFHEVLPTFRERYALSAWFRTNEVERLKSEEMKHCLASTLPL